MSEEDISSSYSIQLDIPPTVEHCKCRILYFLVFFMETVSLVTTSVYFSLCYNQISTSAQVWFGGYIVATMLSAATISVAKYWNRKHCSCLAFLIQAILVVLGALLWIAWTIFGIYIIVDSISSEVWARVIAVILCYQLVRFLMWMIHKKE